MTGKIIKGIAGFYYVYVEETKEAKETASGGTLYECKAKGTFTDIITRESALRKYGVIPTTEA